MSLLLVPYILKAFIYLALHTLKHSWIFMLANDFDGVV